MKTKVNKLRKLKAYFWKPEQDADSGIAVIAESAQKAKHLGYSYWGLEMGHDEYDSWIQQRVTLIKEANIEGLKEIGVIDDYKEGIKRKLYGFVEDDNIECDVCHDCPGIIYQEDIIEDKIICEECREKKTKGDKDE